MISINITNEKEGFVRSTNPEHIEVYIGAMESYEHFDLGGIHWKLPTAMVEDLLAEYAKKTSKVGNPIPEDLQQ